VNRKVWVKNCYVRFWGTPYAQVTRYCACAVNFVAFTIIAYNMAKRVLKVTK